MDLRAAASPIHFAYRPIDFRLDSCETPERHAPQTMAGVVYKYGNMYFTQSLGACNDDRMGSSHAAHP
jgi:hypothetical protein